MPKHNPLETSRDRKHFHLLPSHLPQAAVLTSGAGEGVVELLHHFLQTCACVLGRAEQLILTCKANPHHCMRACANSLYCPSPPQS